MTTTEGVVRPRLLGADERIARAARHLKAAIGEVQRTADEMAHVKGLGNEARILSVYIERLGLFRERLVERIGLPRLRELAVQTSAQTEAPND